MKCWVCKRQAAVTATGWPVPDRRSAPLRDRLGVLLAPLPGRVSRAGRQLAARRDGASHRTEVAA